MGAGASTALEGQLPDAEVLGDTSTWKESVVIKAKLLIKLEMCCNT